MAEDVVVGGPRDVRASRDGPADAPGCVVACPPHPQAGGTRSNPVLVALGEALADRGQATLRFDYGPWDDGEGEVDDAGRAVAWAADRHRAVGLFGYSFGATVALAAAGRAAADPPDGPDDTTDGVGDPPRVAGVVALAPAHRLPAPDTLGALEAVDAPVLVLAAERDRTVDSTPVVERARALGHATDVLPADHHFVGQRATVAGRAADFLGPLLAAASD